MVDFTQQLKKNFLFLAPMAGFSNSVCRQVSREYGADGVVTEFVYSRAVLSGGQRVLEKLMFLQSERPVGIQIFGSDPVELAEAASLIESKLSPDFIDINFGCPAPNATQAGAGSALLKNPKLMCEIIAKVSDSVKIPVTAKMRTGWDCNSIIVPDVAQALADSGAKMITLHGRTKSKGYQGDADWSLIEKTAQSISVPLIGNGSVEKLTSQQLRDSACAGFMIGRSALGNPWIFQEVKNKILNNTDSKVEPSPQERAKLALHYAQLMTAGAYSGINADDLTHAKVQIMRFLKNAQGFKKLRVQLRHINTIEQLKEMLCEYI